MKRINFVTKIFIILIFSAIITIPTPSRAGQIITEDTRIWARKVLGEERMIQATGLPNTIGVLYFLNKTGRKEMDPIQKGLALMLITDLAKIKGLNVVERIKLQALIDEMELGISGLADPNTIPRLGRLFRAKWLIGGNLIEPDPPAFRINSNLLDTSSQNIVKTPAAEGELSELFKMEKDILFDIIKYLKRELLPAEEEELKRPITTNMAAAMALFRGIDASDRGDYRKSAQYYQKALKLDPGLTTAQESLQELKDLGMLVQKKKTHSLLKSIRDRTSLTDQHIPEYPLKRAVHPMKALYREDIYRGQELPIEYFDITDFGGIEGNPNFD